MSKTWLVARHEFSVTVGRLSYRIFAASVPALAVVALIGMVVFRAVASDDDTQPGVSPTSSEPVAVGYVDLTVGPDGRPLFSGHPQQGDTLFTPYADQAAATQDLLAGRIDRLYVFPADYLATGIVTEVRERRAGLRFDSGSGDSALHKFVLANLAAGQVDSALLERIVTPYRIVTLGVSGAGAPADEETDLGEALIFVIAGILYFVSALTASGYLLQSLTEEKESRIMEVLLSSIKPEHLMFGKLIGLGAASLLQMAVWSAAMFGFLMLAPGLISELASELLAVPAPGALLLAFAYFFLGYALVGTLLAAVGAVTTNQRQANNITAVVIVPTMLPLWFLTPMLQNPDGTLARALSFIPITAPVASLARLGLGGMGGLDVAISLSLLSLSVAAAVWLTARLFRSFLLVYDQQLSLGRVVRVLRGR